jgi:hypothetical protein
MAMINIEDLIRSKQITIIDKIIHSDLFLNLSGMTRLSISYHIWERNKFLTIEVFPLTVKFLVFQIWVQLFILFINSIGVRRLPGQQSIMKKQRDYLSGGYEVNV